MNDLRIIKKEFAYYAAFSIGWCLFILGVWPFMIDAAIAIHKGTFFITGYRTGGYIFSATIAPPIIIAMNFYNIKRYVGVLIDLKRLETKTAVVTGLGRSSSFAHRKNNILRPKDFELREWKAKKNGIISKYYFNKNLLLPGSLKGTYEITYYKYSKVIVSMKRKK